MIQDSLKKLADKKQSAKSDKAKAKAKVQAMLRNLFVSRQEDDYTTPEGYESMTNRQRYNAVINHINKKHSTNSVPDNEIDSMFKYKAKRSK